MKLIQAKKKPPERNVEVVESPKYTDLRQVMDYTRPLTIFFSGVEYEHNFEVLYNFGIRNFLVSYEYLKGKGLENLKRFPNVTLFVDSGAFTYMADPEYQSYTVEQWEKQIVQYLAWAEKHKHQIFAIADLDLQLLVGLEKVYEWRKKYFEPFMLRTGIPVCFIYHQEGLDVWEYMCKRYPYVGFSFRSAQEELGDSGIKDLFRVAEKHNALVQGMAATNTEYLVNYPFYTVDSTTWNVGLRYGEMSIWTGTAMARVKKKDLETRAIPLIQKYHRDFDLEKLRSEDKAEWIRANAYAFIEAESYVRERLKARMYWLKKRAVKIDVDSLDASFFPTPDEINNDSLTPEQVKEYGEKMNINPEYEGARGVIYDMTVFLNWDNPDFKDVVAWYTDPKQQEFIQTIHDTYVNRIVSSEEEKYADLTAFFRECLEGKNDKLLQLGTDFDRTVKERDRYVEEEAYEDIELDAQEVRARVAGLLPEPVDNTEEIELEKLDKEIFSKANIAPSFDKKGKFLKGQTAARKPKKMYSDKYPKLACDTCYNAAKCPEYKPGYVCAYSKMFKRFDTRNMSDLIDAIRGIAEFSTERVQRAMVSEVMNGIIDPATSQLMDQSIKYLTLLKSMYEQSSPEVLRQSKVIRSDGTVEQTTQVTNPQQGGVLEKIFGGMGRDKAENKSEDKPIDVKAE